MKILLICYTLCFFQITLQYVSSRTKYKEDSSSINKKNNDPIKELKKNSLYLERLTQSDINSEHSDFNLDESREILLNEKGVTYYNLTFDPRLHSRKAKIFFTFFSKKNDKITFKIRDNKEKRILYQKKTKNVYVGKLQIKNYEDLNFIFENPFNNTIRVVVGFGCFNCKDYDKIAKKEDLEITREKIMRIDNNKGKMIFLSEAYYQKKKNYLESMKKSHGLLVYWSVFEIFVIVFLNIFEIYVIKNLIYKKKLF